MSAWTWTYVKAKAIPENMVISICDNAIKEISNIWYYRNSKSNFDSVLKEWFKIHDEDYDYFVNECDVPKYKMTHEYLEQDLKNKIKTKDEYIKDLNLVKEGKLTLDECVRKHKIYEHHDLDYPQCYLINDDVWVKMNSEIFRLREYSDMYIENGLKTVNELIEYLNEPSRQNNLIWWENSNLKEGMFPEFETRLKEYYGQFGDGNFSVHFG